MGRCQYWREIPGGGIIPFNFLKRSNGTGDYSHSGIGDVSVLGYYQLMNRSSATKADKVFVQSYYLIVCWR